MTTAPIVLVVPCTIPSANARDKWHWRKRNQETRTWEIFFRAAVRTLPRRPTGKVRVAITSLRTALIHDKANLSAGAKGCVDALVRLGFLRDDRDEYADITYEQVQAPKPLRCTRIEIRPELGS